MKILAVDDNPTNLEILKVLLRSGGFTVLEAACGTEAVAVAAAEQPELIFMDLSMPGEIDGLEATRRIRGCPETAAIVVVAVTAMVTRSDRSDAAEAGCNDFIRKPYTRRDLFDMIGRYFPDPLQPMPSAPR